VIEVNGRGFRTRGGTQLTGRAWGETSTARVRESGTAIDAREKRRGGT